MSDDSSSCTNDYINKNKKLIREWNYIIAPDGDFYAIAEKGIDLLNNDCSFIIEQAVRNLFNLDLINYYREQKMQHPEYRNIALSASDILVSVLGYAVYNHCNAGLEFKFPKKSDLITFNTSFTDCQLEKLLRLANINEVEQDELFAAFCKNEQKRDTTTMEAKMKVYSA